LAKLSAQQKKILFGWLQHRSYEECRRLVQERFGLSVSVSALHFSHKRHLVGFRQENSLSVSGTRIYLVIETTSPEKLRVRLLR
jgi:hypothetical protein